MKTHPYHPTNNNTNLWNGISDFHQSVDYSRGTRSYPDAPIKAGASAGGALKSAARRNRILTGEAAAEMAQGSIPDLEQVCRDLHGTFFLQSAPHTALQFIPVLKNLVSPKRSEIERFLQHPQTNHVLVQNALLKVVLIHWAPGKLSSIHGHPQGGCVFKVLQGRLEEKRYSPDESQRLLAVSTCQQGSMAYIDDNMAYHAVGNPFNTPAVSLHVYTPGR